MICWCTGSGRIPESFLADDDDASNRGDRTSCAPSLNGTFPVGVRITARNLRRLITMRRTARDSSSTVQTRSVSRWSYHTVRDYIDLFEQAYVVRALPLMKATSEKDHQIPKSLYQGFGLLPSLRESEL
jgi:predicted AAA+ superfamily ATPase